MGTDEREIVVGYFGDETVDRNLVKFERSRQACCVHSCQNYGNMRLNDTHVLDDTCGLYDGRLNAIASRNKLVDTTLKFSIGVDVKPTADFKKLRFQLTPR